MNKKTSIFILLALVAFYIVYIQFSWNFTLLAVALMGILAGTAWLNHIFERKAQYPDFNLRYVATLALAIFTWLTCWTLSNYFSPEENIYTNSDYHAIRADGVRLSKERIKNFKLAGSKDAFFDKKEYQGNVTVADADEEGVTLRLSNFMHGVYANTYERKGENEGRWVKSKLLNKRIIVFNATDTLVFHSRDRKRYTFSMQEYFADNQNDTTYCIYTLDNASARNRAIMRVGLSLNDALSGMDFSGVSFKGIHIARATMRNTEAHPDTIRQTPFVLEIGEEARQHLAKVTVKGKGEYPIPARGEEHVHVKYGQYISIGAMGQERSLSVSFERDTTASGAVTMKFATPLFQRLSPTNPDGSNSTLVTTTLSSVVNSNSADNIILFDLFDRTGNPWNLSSPLLLSYTASSPNTMMQFKINAAGRSETVNEGEYFPSALCQASRTGAQWLLKIENFKNTPGHLHENGILLFIVLLGGLGILLFQYAPIAASLDGHSDEMGKTFTTIEFGGFIIMMYMLALRLLLMWRADVFAPIDIISVYETNHFFQNGEMAVWLCVGLNIFLSALFTQKHMALYMSYREYGYPTHKLHGLSVVMLGLLEGFVYAECRTLGLAEIAAPSLYVWGLLWASPLIGLALIAVSKFFFQQNTYDWIQKKIETWRSYPLWKKWLCFAAYLFVMVIAMSVLKLFSPRIIGLLVPVLWYFVSDALIYAGIADSYKKGQEAKKQDKLEWTDFLNYELFFSLCNGAVIAIMLTAFDGGYGIIFISFFMLMSVLKIYDYSRGYIKNTDKTFKYKAWGTFSLLLLLPLGYVFYKDIFKCLLQMDFWVLVAYGTAVVMLIMFIVLQLILNIRLMKNLKSALTTVVTAFVVSCVAVYGTKYFILDDTDHMTQRVNVTIYEPDEALRNHIKTPGNERRFFEASLNDYILSVYNKQGEEVASWGKDGVGYFRLQPYSRLGAMCGAQVSDILTARFLIAEHGKWLPIWILLLSLVLFHQGLTMKTYGRASKFVLIQIPALLFVHALFVWMANTRTFIFIGQDMPLMSLQSKFTIFYYFLLMTIWMAVAAAEKWKQNQSGELEAYSNYYQGVNNSLCLSLAIAVALLVCYCYAPSAQYDKEKYNKVNNLLQETDMMMTECINPAFRRFQQSKNAPKTKNVLDVFELVSAFDKEYKDSIRLWLSTDGIDNRTLENSTFHYRLWENYVESGSKENSSTSVLHVRRNNNEFYFDVLRNYFDRILPKKSDEAWQGSIVEQRSHKEHAAGKAAKIASNKDFDQYKIPAELTADNTSQLILVAKNPKQEPTVASDGISQHERFDFGKGYKQACRQFEADHVANNAGLHEPVFYFARNVLINGRQDFLYPMGATFAWIRNYAQESAFQYDYSQEKQHGNKEITIDHKLTQKLYETLKKQNYQRAHGGFKYASAIVANGNGEIQAMVDYKPNHYSSLDPNDKKRIKEIMEELYMNYNSQLSDWTFGNLNLQNMKSGPGSSQKPIVWTAVASGIEGIDWEELEMPPLSNSVKANHYTVWKFNGEPFEHKPLASLPSDENYGRGVTLKQYMSRSSNFYNALMLYIGGQTDVNEAFCKVASKKDGSTLLALLDENKNFGKKWANHFPVLKYKGKTTQLNAKIPVEPGQALFNRRMELLFGMPTHIGIQSPQYISLDSTQVARGTNRNNVYAYAEEGKLEYSNSIAKEYMQQFIQRTAVGGATWMVSPLKMAEMFGTLTMLNRNFHLSIVPQKARYEAIGSLSDTYLDARKELLEGMNQVFGAEGTMARAGNYGKDDKGRIMLDNYYLYGKTGTTGESANTGEHRLAVVITNKPIEELSTKELAKTRFYVVYLTGDTSRKTAYVSILRSVISSERFKKYMAERQDN